MSKQLCDYIDADPSASQARSELVPQIVEVEVLDTSPLRRSGERTPNDVTTAKRITSRVNEHKILLMGLQ